MDIIEQKPNEYTVLCKNISLFSFTTFQTPEIIASNYEDYDLFNADIDKYFNNYAIDARYECICIEPISYNENITIDEWTASFELIATKFSAMYNKVYYKLKVIGNKFSYVCAKANLVYLTNLFVDDFDDEVGMKNQEFLIYER